MAVQYPKYKNAAELAQVQSGRVLLENSNYINWADEFINQSNTRSDQAGRLRVSSPSPLGDYKLINNRLPNFFDTVTNGTGAVTYSSSHKAHDMQTSADGDWAIVETFQRHNYFAGKSQFVELTCFDFDDEPNIEKRTGYYSSNTTTPFQTNLDGFYLYTDGTQHYLRIVNRGTDILNIPQSEWDDPLDGTGDSGFNINWETFNVFQFSFLWLGGTGMRFSLVSGDRVIQVHNYNHIESANADKLIFSSPNQPVRHEIRQTGAGSGQFLPVCATIITEGSDNSADIGEVLSTDSGVANNIQLSYPERGIVKGLRLNATNLDLIVDVVNVDTFASTTNDFFRWELVLNPDIVDGVGAPVTPTWSNFDNGLLQETTGDGAIFAENGTLIAAGYGGSRNPISSQIKSARKLGGAIDGTPDEFYLIISPLQGTTNIDVFGSLTVKLFI